jgi:hypothetical protein
MNENKLMFLIDSKSSVTLKMKLEYYLTNFLHEFAVVEHQFWSIPEGMPYPNIWQLAVTNKSSLQILRSTSAAHRSVPSEK